MNCKLVNVTKVEIENYVLPFIPKNKRGFTSKVDPIEIVKCIIHKLKTGTQLDLLFVDIECVNYGFS